MPWFYQVCYQWQPALRLSPWELAHVANTDENDVSEFVHFPFVNTYILSLLVGRSSTYTNYEYKN